MPTKLLQASTLAAVVGFTSINADAASIWLQPTTQTIGLNGVATLEMYADASDVGGFLAGGLDMFYDNSILTYNGDFAFDPGFPTNPAIS